MKKSCKALFPIFDNNPGLVYLDSAASAQKPAQVINAMADFMSKDYSNIHRGLYPLAIRAGEVWERARTKSAKFLNAKPDEIVFARGATSAINLAAKCLASALRLNSDDVVLCSVAEHHSNMLPWRHLGCKVNYVGLAPDMRIDLTDLQTKLADGKVKVVALSGQSNVLGVVNDIKAVADLAHAAGAVVLIDAAQLAVHSKLDVIASGVDMLAFSAHKIYGPTGIGVLYVRSALLERFEPVEFGGDMVESVSLGNEKYLPAPQRLEAGTMPLVEAAGLSAALDFMEALDFSRVRKLTDYAHERLAEIRGYRPISPKGSDGLVAFNLDGLSPFDIASVLAKKNICVRAGHHCAEPLHGYLGLAGSLRASFGVYNDESDVDALADALAKSVEILK